MVIKTLFEACSQDPLVLKHAESRLKTWEVMPGFYSVVASVFMNREYESKVRWMAALIFKNGIDRYWRRTCQNGIVEEEKQFLKRNLITKFDEPHIQIATQISVLIGKIARLDCPKFWPELVPVLVQSIQVEDSLQQHRAMLTLYHVTKSLASKRMAQDKKVFEELTYSIFGFLFNLWKQCYDEFVLESNHLKRTEVLLSCLSKYILITKILKKLMTYGFQDIRNNGLALEFVEMVLHRLDALLLSRNAFKQFESAEVMQHWEKIIMLLSKTLLEVIGAHEEGFAKFVRSSLQFVTVYCFTEDRRELIFEQFVINSFNLMKKIFTCDKYKLAKIPEETKSEIALEVHKAKSEFFTRGVLTELCKQLLFHYLLLTQDELSCWDRDPESFMSEESGDSWMFSLKPCTESLFLNLIKEFRDTVTPIVLELLQECENCDDGSLIRLLQKDAVYNAIGLASYDFYDLIDFDKWFDKLINDLQNKSSMYRILRRRIIWLVGNWVGVKLSPELRPRLYAVIQSLMDRSEDVVIRLEAAFALKAAIDDAEFQAENYVPFLESHFNLLFNLLKDVSQCETKMAVLHVMTFVIERMEEQIRPYTPSLVHYLPLLWQASDDHNLLRCAIINNLSLIVQGLGSETRSLYDFLIPVIHASTDVNHEQHIYLWEDALDLWLITLHASSQMTPELLQLFQNLLPLLESGSEALKTCLKIIEAYVVIDAGAFLQKYHSMLGQTITTLLQELKTEGEVFIFKLLSNMLRVCPHETIDIFKHVFVDVIKSLANFSGEQTNPCPSLYCIHIVMISRLVIHSHQVFFQLVDEISHQTSTDASTIMDSLIAGWLAKSSCLYQPEKKKLCVLALLSLLPTNHRSILNSINTILLKTADALSDICRKDSESGILVDTCVMTSDHHATSDSGDEGNGGEEFEKRSLEISLRDPVYSVSLIHFTANQLQLLQTPVLDSIDTDASQQLRHFLSNV